MTDDRIAELTEALRTIQHMAWLGAELNDIYQIAKNALEAVKS